MATQRIITKIGSEAAVAALPKAGERTRAHVINQTAKRRNRRLGLALSYLVLILAALFALYPVYFAFLVSIRPNGQLLSLNLVDMFIPTTGISLDSYNKMLFGNQPYFAWLGNSLFIATSTAISCVLLATSAAFAISRLRFFGRNALLILFLAIQAFPGVLALNAIINLLIKLDLYGKSVGLILAYTAGTLVFCTWNLKGYFDTIPVEIEESALIDGCNTLQSFYYVLLPLSIPVVAVTALFGFLAGWGEYPLAAAIIPAPATHETMPVALYGLANSRSVPWGLFAAGSMLVAIPTMLLFLYMQRFLQSGLTAGGVKG